MSFDFKYHAQWLESPGYLLAEVPPQVREELESSIRNLNEDTAESYTTRLKGHLEKEYALPITPHIKFLTESMAYEFARQFYIERASGQTEVYADSENGLNYELLNLWVNYQKKHDFNPIHNHAGAYSFAIWVQIPYDLEEEQKRYKTNGNETALFAFRYISPLGGIDTKSLPIDKSWEWKMAFFPAKLNHTVNPFYTSDEYRISISGNVFLRENGKANVSIKEDFKEKMFTPMNDYVYNDQVKDPNFYRYKSSKPI